MNKKSYAFPTTNIVKYADDDQDNDSGKTRGISKIVSKKCVVTPTLKDTAAIRLSVAKDELGNKVE